MTNRITCCLHLAVLIRVLMTGEDHIEDEDATYKLSPHRSAQSPALGALSHTPVSEKTVFPSLSVFLALQKQKRRGLSIM